MVTAGSGELVSCPQLWLAAAVQPQPQEHRDEHTQEAAPSPNTPHLPGLQNKAESLCGDISSACVWGAGLSGTAGIGVPSLLPRESHIPRDPSRGSEAVDLRDLHPNKHHDVTLSKPCKESA